MCGIAGCLGSPLDTDVLNHALDTALQAIHHRGPDGGGRHIEPEAGLALGHRRLAIVDLSPAGHQPMHDAGGRLTLVYNGEIYNHAELRAALDRDSGGALAWRGHSDTETLLAGFARWGIEETLQRSVGMFAIALWDRATRVLTLARDRLGEKPLYVGRAGGSLLFGSDMASFRRWPGFNARLNRRAAALYMERGWVPGPDTIYEGFRKLPPGHLMTVRAEDLRNSDWPASRPYWSILSVVHEARTRTAPASLEEAVNRLDVLLRKAISRQMIADVPLGAFLSGGVDSSTVVGIMQAISNQRVRTYSIGFHEKSFDEAQHARLVAKHLGTDHTALYVSPSDALTLVPRLASTFSEPFADASQLPTMLLSSLTRQHVTVALSGDGGDELFGGYNRHLVGAGLWRRLAPVPGQIRAAMAKGLSSVSPETWNRLYGAVGGALPRRLRMRLPGAKLHKLASVLNSPDTRSFYLGLSAPGRDAGLMRDAAPSSLPALNSVPTDMAPAEQMMLMDAMTYLPDDVLVKVDRSTMAASLEARAPLLDHTVFEFAWTLPLAYKIADGLGKRVLRGVLDHYVPRALIDRPKMGLTTPIDAWLRGALRDWAEALLSRDRLAHDGVLDPQAVRTLWDYHLSGRADHSSQLWTVLMFQAWREQWHA